MTKTTIATESKVGRELCVYVKLHEDTAGMVVEHDHSVPGKCNIFTEYFCFVFNYLWTWGMKAHYKESQL